MTSEQPLRVILADDDADARFLLRRTLERSGRFSIVAEAGDGAEASTLTKQHEPDLVILDLKMPKVDGIAALPAIRSAAPRAVVVVVSTLPREHLANRAVDAGAHAFIGKSVSPKRLLSILLKTIADTRPGAIADSSAGTVREAQLSLGLDRRSPSAARRFVASTLIEWGCDAVADEATLVTSELVTNAIVHADSAPELVLRFANNAVHIEVRDHSTGSPLPNDAEPGDTGGRGLAMVDRIAAAWGVTPTADGGKAVWVELSCPTPVVPGGTPITN